MTDKEELTALLMAGAGDCLGKGGALNCSKLADYLIANGVVVPSELGIKNELLEWINKDCNKTKHSTKEG